MTSPFLQPSWTIEEAVLLVEASENIASKVGDVDAEARRLSERLRKSAELTGLTVSARYRNEEDVRNNLKSMSSMLKMIDYIDEEYLQGSTLGSVALYYRKYPERYTLLLDKANTTYPVIEKPVKTDANVAVEVSVYNTTDLPQTLEVVNEEESKIGIKQELIGNFDNDENYNSISEIQDGINQGSDAESAPIDTVSEGVSTYYTSRRKRPRITTDNAGKGESGIKFSSIFPHFSSQYLSTHRPERQKSQAESVWFSSLETQHLRESIDKKNSVEKDSKIEIEKEDCKPEESRNNTINSKLENIREILVTEFRRGYRMGSVLDRKRFRRYYKDRFEKSVGATEEVVEGYIKNLGFEFDGKVYITDIILPADVRDRICAFIIDVLTTERDYVFFEHIYEHFRDEVESSITDTQMLKLYLKELNRQDWIFREGYIASSFDVMVSVRNELLQYMLEASGVRNLEEVKQELNYLPKEEVVTEWTRNSTLVSNGPNEKFHIETFYCPEETLNAIVSLIESGLKDSSFMTSEGLFEDLKLNLPELISNNDQISGLGMRNALAKLLSKRFSFKNNVISTTQDSLDGPTAIMAFCKDRGYFTFEDIEDISGRIGCAPNFYLDKIYEKYVRIDDNNFVPKSQVSFDVRAIDAALDLFVKDRYTVMNDILTFDAFPSCGEFLWNKWILENYLLTASKKYTLIRPKYLSKDSVTGAIVRRDGTIKTYDDLIIQSIANSEIPIEEEAANDYLFQMGIINARRKNGQVKNALIKAREYRNRIKNTNRN